MTDPYFIIPGTIFIKTERPDIKNAYDLQGKRIALMIEDYAEEWLHQHNIKGGYTFFRGFQYSITNSDKRQCRCF